MAEGANRNPNPPSRAAASSAPSGRPWWSGMWLSNALLIACATEEGWRPETACSARDAANWLRRKGITVIEAQNDRGQAQPLRATVPDRKNV
jgi:hypothetical protein